MKMAKTCWLSCHVEWNNCHLENLKEIIKMINRKSRHDSYDSYAEVSMPIS